MRLLLAYEDWRLEMYVNDDKKFVVARLEEKMLDVAEQDVDFVRTARRCVP
jgi:hypothetical protein